MTIQSTPLRDAHADCLRGCNAHHSHQCITLHECMENVAFASWQAVNRNSRQADCSSACPGLRTAVNSPPRQHAPCIMACWIWNAARP